MARGGARPGAGRKKGGINKTADRRRRIKEAATERAVTELAITKEAVLGELAKLSFSNMLDYMRVGPDGQPTLNFADLTRDQAAALVEVTVEEFKIPGEADAALEDQSHGGALRRTQGREVRKVKFKLADKRGPLVDLGKHLGLFKERVEHSGPDGGPVEVRQYTDIEAARLIGRLLSKVSGSGS